jgi:methylmalonyl-CoA mutase cobalamin-binding subunit
MLYKLIVEGDGHLLAAILEEHDFDVRTLVEHESTNASAEKAMQDLTDAVAACRESTKHLAIALTLLDQS